jgi:hypothetical protein
VNWRTGRKIELNVYKGDKPMFQCHSRRDAKRAVRLLNWGERWLDALRLLERVVLTSSSDAELKNDIAEFLRSVK